MTNRKRRKRKDKQRKGDTAVNEIIRKKRIKIRKKLELETKIERVGKENINRERVKERK